MIVDRGAIHRRAGDVVLLAEHIDPSVLVAAAETGIDPAPGQMVEDRELLGCSDRIPAGQHESQWRNQQIPWRIPSPTDVAAYSIRSTICHQTRDSALTSSSSSAKRIESECNRCSPVVAMPHRFSLVIPSDIGRPSHCYHTYMLSDLRLVLGEAYCRRS